jgi:hypothetical protein
MAQPPRKAVTGGPANAGPQPINRAKFDRRLRELDELIAAEQAEERRKYGRLTRFDPSGGDRNTDRFHAEESKDESEAGA